MKMKRYEQFKEAHFRDHQQVSMAGKKDTQWMCCSNPGKKPE